jgi:hypothetical protein
MKERAQPKCQPQPQPHSQPQPQPQPHQLQQFLSFFFLSFFFPLFYFSYSFFSFLFFFLYFIFLILFFPLFFFSFIFFCFIPCLLILFQATLGVPPSSQYQVAPWIAWEAAVTDVVMDIDFALIKKLNIDHTKMTQGDLNLYSLESAHFFMMWEKWIPWRHYGDQCDALLDFHQELLKKNYSKVSFFLFF